jgi:hypothetical protein
VAIDSDDEPHVAFARTCTAPPSWWWDKADHWPDTEIAASYSNGFGLLPASDLQYRKRATTWQTQEMVAQDKFQTRVESLADAPKIGYRFNSPSLVLLSDDSPCLVWSHRPKEVCQGAQIYYGLRGEGGIWSQTRLSDGDRMADLWNCEPILSRTSGDDLHLFWEGRNRSVSPDWDRRGCWFRTMRDGAWGRIISPQSPIGYNLERLIKPLGPITPSGSGWSGFALSALSSSARRGKSWPSSMR